MVVVLMPMGQGGTLRYLPVETAAYFHLVVGIDLRVVTGPRDCYVGHAAIDEIFAAPGIDMNEDTLGSLSLAAVTGNRVSVVEVRMLLDVETHIAFPVHANG